MIQLIHLRGGFYAAASALADRIESSLLLLSSQPYLGKVPDDEYLIDMGYRYSIVDTYLIFFTIENGMILVHRILHGARDYTLFGGADAADANRPA